MAFWDINKLFSLVLLTLSVTVILGFQAVLADSFKDRSSASRNPDFESISNTVYDVSSSRNYRAINGVTYDTRGATSYNKRNKSPVQQQYNRNSNSNRYTQQQVQSGQKQQQTSRAQKFPFPKRVSLKVEDGKNNFKACGGFSGGYSGTCCSACESLNFHEGCWCRSFDCLCYSS